MRVTHGLSNSGTYQTWEAMIQRCTNPRSTGWKDYGGRGITVCERWRKFENFLADMGERPCGMTLDRIKNDQCYCKDNCRWATRKQQLENQRIRSDNQSGHRGVSRDRRTGKWQVYCRQKFVGTFREISDAVAAYEAALVGD